MPTGNWINETLYPDWGQRFQVTRELARVKSDFQDIAIFESASHGRVMVLDGVIQITEADEFVYQEMLTHVPLLAHGAAQTVLIIGAGDGGDRWRGDPPVEGISAEDRGRRVDRHAGRGHRGRRDRLRQARP